MFATLVTLSLFAATFGLMVSMIRTDGARILSALRGDGGWTTAPATVRSNPVTVRFHSRYRQDRSVRAQVEWRAAA